MNTLEHIIEAAKTLPPEDRRRLHEWLVEQEHRDALVQPQPEARQQPVEKSRRTLNWLDEHRDQYLGQWVALDGDRIVSHGSDPKEVYRQAKAAGVRVPFVELVTEEDTQPFCGGWQP